MTQQIAIYETPDGTTETKRKIGNPDFSTRELNKNSVVRNFRRTGTDDEKAYKGEL